MLAFSRNWGVQKQDALRAVLGQLIVTDIGPPPVLDAYADLATYAKEHGHSIGHNDLWIAATAVAAGATVLTTDRDFEALRSAGVDLEWVDPAGLK